MTSNNSKIINTLKACILFSKLSEKEICEIADISTLTSIKAGQVLFNDEDPARAFYIVISGQMRIYKLSASGREQTLLTPGPGISIAEAAIFSGDKYPAYVSAVTDAELICIGKDNFLNLLKKRPQIAINLIGLLSERLKIFARKIEELSLMGVVPRLAAFLLDKSTDNKVSLDISKGELASMIGTVPETLSRALAKLKAGGFITEKDNVVEINNPDGLSEIVTNYN
jgi:CRP/FNR family transcriptional regulator